MTSVGTIAIGHPISFELLTTRGKYGVYVRHDPEGIGKYVVCQMPSKRSSKEFTPANALAPFPDLRSAETICNAGPVTRYLRSCHANQKLL
jgi:hypothetical protein